MKAQLLSDGTILLTSKNLLLQLLCKHILIVVELAFKSALLVAYALCHFLATETNSNQPTYP